MTTKLIFHNVKFLIHNLWALTHYTYQSLLYKPIKEKLFHSYMKDSKKKVSVNQLTMSKGLQVHSVSDNFLSGWIINCDNLITKNV